MSEWVVLAVLVVAAVGPLFVGGGANLPDQSAPSNAGSIAKHVFGLLVAGPPGPKLNAAPAKCSFWTQVWAMLAGAEILVATAHNDVGSSELATAQLGANVSVQPAIAQRQLSFAGATLIDKQWEGADLSGANLAGANLSHANLNRANLAGAVLNDSILASARLSRATIMSALLLNADLTDADLSWANLSGADLTGARLTNTILLGVTWSSQTLWPDDVRSDVERRSIVVGPGLYQILPIETDDRVLVQ